MKKVLVLIIYMFGISNAYTQEVSDARTQVIPCNACTQVLIKAVEKSALTIDSLQKQVIKPLNDSIVKLRSAHSIEVTRLNEQLNASEIERNELIIKNKSLESTIAELNVNQIKLERDSLQAKYNSQLVRLKELENLISTKDKQIEQEKELGLLKSVQEKEKGKSEILNQILETYNSSLDKLIINTSLYSTERDISIVGDKTVVGQNLLSLKKYFNSEQVLAEKYNQQRIENAVNNLKSVEQTKLVCKLIQRLNDYKLCNDGLKTTIDKILEVDKKFIANDEYTQKTKLNDVLAEIAWYFRNYRFNFIDYPYLSEVVLEIINLKQEDANAEIANLKEKL